MSLKKGTVKVDNIDDLQPSEILGIKETLSLNNVDNTSDADKPVSIAQQGALNEKVDVVPNARLITDIEANKLVGIQENATENQTDVFLLNRENHTGQQPQSSVTGLTTKLNELDEKIGLDSESTFTINNIWSGSQVDYDNLSNYLPNVIYFIDED